MFMFIPFFPLEHIEFQLSTISFIYGCPAATMYKYLGRNQIENSIIKNELEKQFNTCRGCPYKYFCGGECQLEVNADLKEHAELCKLKQALINFAAYLKIYAIRNNPNFF